MSETETYTEYGVFIWHGSAQVLHRTFKEAETVGIWRTCNGDVEVASIRTRPVTIQIGEWSEVPA